MLRNLSRLLTPANPVDGTSSACDLKALRAEALSERAAADARARSLEVTLRGAREVLPDPTSAEIWTYRPAAWSDPALHPHLLAPTSGAEIAPGLTIFHDCPIAESAVRQMLSPASGSAPFHMRIEVLRFEGSFLSFCLQLPESAAAEWDQQEIIRITLTARMESPINIFGRLNLVQGPNEQSMLAHFPFDQVEGETATVAFDLASAGLEPEPITGAWIDLIFEKPGMNAIDLADLRVSHCAKADL